MSKQLREVLKLHEVKSMDFASAVKAAQLRDAADFFGVAAADLEDTSASLTIAWNLNIDVQKDGATVIEPVVQNIVGTITAQLYNGDKLVTENKEFDARKLGFEATNVYMGEGGSYFVQSVSINFKKKTTVVVFG